MNIVLLSTDLMVVARVEGSAAQLGARVQVANNSTIAVTSCAENRAAVLIVDLSTPMLDLTTIGEFATATDRATQIVAFGPHVHKERLDAARAAGCDSVLSRGQFFNELSTLLTTMKNRAC